MAKKTVCNPEICLEKNRNYYCYAYIFRSLVVYKKLTGSNECDDQNQSISAAPKN